ncbi:MAG: aminomethyl-transferring glycine dehydrogenase subunit GcvPB, partial [Firmicutes bacterium]|nr:aminomethyl-transferring glycine dehydrogenase subunit GcvPB [Bacillota bacterium]
MKYYNTLIFELSKSGRIGYSLPKNAFASKTLKTLLPSDLLRKDAAKLPEVSELDVVRHFTNVSQKNFGVESGF